KDSLSMNTVWQQDGEAKAMTAPLSLIVSAFASLHDVRQSRTPQLLPNMATTLLLVDIGGGRNRLGGSALAQVFEQTGDTCPDIDSTETFVSTYNAVQQLFSEGLVLAAHDRSDGGLIISALEMAFAGHTGVRLNVNNEDAIAALFSEELGWLLQVDNASLEQIERIFSQHGVADALTRVGQPVEENTFTVVQGDNTLVNEPLAVLRKHWWQTSYEMQRLRDNPDTAGQEFALQCADNDPGLSPSLTFTPGEKPPAYHGQSPRVAILREQGVNGQVEMAAAFYQAGFESIDVHMTDILSGRVELSAFTGLVACGGFSYGDVLGAGAGWANTIVHNERARDQFQTFFNRDNTFALGVCNGCQMFSHLHTLIPGAAHWPRFTRNTSEQFEARLTSVVVEDSPSILLQGMQGSVIPVAVAHGEGRAELADESLVTLRYVDNHGHPTTAYPLNPNGSTNGVTGLCSDDGRFNIMMPHPERVFRTAQFSWHPPQWGEHSPWMTMFHNARRWVAQS
ncbi:MAG: phosphoribosylformylglycinamidine synthase subunit PurQ, partial [Pseudomonadota bacterium]